MESNTVRASLCSIKPLRKRAGFTLIEVLAVMLIMVTIMAVAVPMLPSVLKASKLRNAANALVDYLTFARQTAMTRNCRVEVRFYKLDTSGGAKIYSSFRAFAISSDGTATALGKIKVLDKPVMISDLSTQNKIFRDPPYQGTEDLPRFGTTGYYKFSFLPGGKTDLDPGSNWFMTLYENQGDATSRNPLPQNYVVLQVDEFTGHIRLYRP